MQARVIGCRLAACTIRSSQPLTRFEKGSAPLPSDRAGTTVSQLLCHFIKKFLHDFSRMKRESVADFAFQFQFLARISTSEIVGQEMVLRNSETAGS